VAKFKVEIEWAGYSRGISTWEVEADTIEEAKEIYYEGERVKHKVVRDDIDCEVITVDEIQQIKAPGC
jgi:hypothetical protein